MSVIAALAVAAIAGAVIETPRLQAVSGAVASSIVTVEPTRVLDTRFGTGISGDLIANEGSNVQITGSIPTRQGDANVFADVVPAGATGVLLNVTALRPQADGFFSVRPGTATGEPDASNLNFTAGSVVPNAVTVALPTAGAGVGSIDVWYGTATAGATTGALVDVIGYTIEATGGGTAGPTGPAGAAGVDGTDGVDGVDGADGDELYEHIVVVNGDGTGTVNAAALRTALGTAAGSSSSTEPWLISLEPGTYDLGALALKIPDYVSVRGSGRRGTQFTGTADNLIRTGDATVLSALSIDQTGTSITAASAVQVDGIDVVIQDVYIQTAGDDGINITSGFDNVLVLNAEIDAADFAIDFAGAGNGTVRDSILTSSTQETLRCTSGATCLVENSSLTTTAAGREPLEVPSGDVTVRHSTLVSTTDDIAGGSASGTVRLHQVHVDTAVTNAYPGTITCIGISTPTAWLDTTCP